MTSCAKQFIPYPLRISIQLSVVWQSGERISQGDRYVEVFVLVAFFPRATAKIQGVKISIDDRVPIERPV